MKIYVKASVYDEIYYSCIQVKINGKTFDLFYEMTNNDSLVYDLANSLKSEISTYDGHAPLKYLFDAISGAAYTDIKSVDGYEVKYIQPTPIDYTSLGTIYIDWDNEECGTKQYYKDLYDEFVADGSIDLEIYGTFNNWFASITDKNGSVSEIKYLD